MSMWRSCLLINVGDNPDRPRPGRTWLRNLYHVHQRLCMAFPSDPQSDPLFLKPFKPENLDGKQVHVERGGGSGFLYRIDPQPGGRVVIVVQSAAEPNWHYAFQNAGHLLRDFLAAPPHAEKFDACFTNGQQLRFRIRVNLSKKIKRSADGVDLTKARDAVDRHGRAKAQSKRVALTWDKNQDPQDAIREWFAKKGKNGGFELGAFRLLHIGWGAGLDPNRKPAEHDDGPRDLRMRFRSALLEGTLTVENSANFREIVLRGMGAGKAFGFGLLSVAPCNMPRAAEAP